MRASRGWRCSRLILPRLILARPILAPLILARIDLLRIALARTEPVRAGLVRSALALLLTTGSWGGTALAQAGSGDDQAAAWTSRAWRRHGYFGDNPFDSPAPATAEPTYRPASRPYPPVLPTGPARPPPHTLPQGLRYRCDDPPGYYPYINACRVQWRPVSSPDLR
ncbi:hypothetical protein [Rhodopila sp.]|jgi:hypothetical protein|uniref:hypothetical protein n=1 Tax=Rhodopila sp. TaxID=2480087 RepID=UPI002B9B40CD|nr:hypothetical protein [Rhodopila sp.]HVZ08064.1 hypothetical protein [Rhodopila sp.]